MSPKVSPWVTGTSNSLPYSVKWMWLSGHTCHFCSLGFWCCTTVCVLYGHTCQLPQFICSLGCWLLDDIHLCGFLAQEYHCHTVQNKLLMLTLKLGKRFAAPMVETQEWLSSSAISIIRKKWIHFWIPRFLTSVESMNWELTTNFIRRHVLVITELSRCHECLGIHSSYYDHMVASFL